MNFIDVLCILMNFAGALAVFLFGMKLMSEGLQKFAGSKMRHIMGKVTSNPFWGILTGTAITVAIQSSSATTVMVVSFVNAGILSLQNSIAVIMGANIGTTVTAWIITLFGLGESSGLFSLPMLLCTISLAFMFSKKDKMKSLGEFIIGLALLLVGMKFLQNAMPNLEDYPNFLSALASMSGHGMLSVLLFVAIGALLTCVVQASAAMMAITLVMCYNGWIGFDIAVALVMGQNIGTTITANLAAIVANTNGKRAARAHLVFNILGVLITLILFRPILNLIANITEGILAANPYAAIDAADYKPEAIPLALSLFHTFFNLANTLILVWFIPQIVKLVNQMVKETSDEKDAQFKLKYIGNSWMNTAELNLEAAKKEIVHFSTRIQRMYSFLPELVAAKEDEEFNAIFSRIEKYEEITDHMESEIAKYLTRVAEGDLSKQGSQRISAMLRIIDNLESIGDTIYQIGITRQNKRETAVHFDEHLKENLAQIGTLVQKAIDIMHDNLDRSYENLDITAASEAEESINQYRNQLRIEHLEALKKGTYDYTVGSTYSSLYALYEKLGDFVINVSEAIAIKFV